MTAAPAPAPEPAGSAAAADGGGRATPSGDGSDGPPAGVAPSASRPPAAAALLRASVYALPARIGTYPMAYSTHERMHVLGVGSWGILLTQQQLVLRDEVEVQSLEGMAGEDGGSRLPISVARAFHAPGMCRAVGVLG